MIYLFMSETQKGMSRIKIQTIGHLVYDAMCSTSY